LSAWSTGGTTADRKVLNLETHVHGVRVLWIFFIPYHGRERAASSSFREMGSGECEAGRKRR